jgi:hypothetical protein
LYRIRIDMEKNTGSQFKKGAYERIKVCPTGVSPACDPIVQYMTLLIHGFTLQLITRLNEMVANSIAHAAIIRMLYLNCIRHKYSMT